VQVTEFMGGPPGLFGTGYGHIAMVKLGLFVVLLALAAINRLALTERSRVAIVAITTLTGNKSERTKLPFPLLRHIESVRPTGICWRRRLARATTSGESTFTPDSFQAFLSG
jgi:hypothetical protein